MDTNYCAHIRLCVVPTCAVKATKVYHANKCQKLRNVLHSRTSFLICQQRPSCPCWKDFLDQLVLAEVFPDGQGHSAQPRPEAKNGNRNIAEEKEAKKEK